MTENKENVWLLTPEWNEVNTEVRSPENEMFVDFEEKSFEPKILGI